MSLTLEDFWLPLLKVEAVSSQSLVAGWHTQGSALDTFSEAPLSISTELSAEQDPRKSNIILVSAPGAVGKTTLAREIAARTNAVYVDLAKADPVGGNAVSGGLLKSGIYEGWQRGATALLIDGLDEARIRVTQEAFEAFLRDVAHISAGRNLPTALFGRTGSIQDAWLILDEGSVSKVVLEIGYYNTEQATNFASARVAGKRKDNAYASVDRQAVSLLLDKLREQTSRDGDRFAGYAPVLQAVADRISAEENPSSLIASINKGAQPVTLQSVVNAILERERSKLSQLTFENLGVSERLYLPEEQLNRLICKIFKMEPPALPTMSSTDSQVYSSALDTWVDEHPFLDGTANSSSAVFDAVLSVHALNSSKAKDAALNRELARGSAANPFLAEFYLPPDVYDNEITQQKQQSRVFVPAAHVGIIYSSMRARLTLADSACLTIESESNDEDHQGVAIAEVDISLDRKGESRQRDIIFQTRADETFRFGAYIEDININVPQGSIEIGNGSEVLLVAPVNVQCEILDIAAKRLIVEQQQNSESAAVFLEAEHCESSILAGVPIIRGNTKLSAVWPNVSAYPWTSFAAQPTQTDDPQLQEALRRFRKFIIAFRSHSKGALRRIRFKLEHARMTKGPGIKILNYLKAKSIITLHGDMYELDPTRLGAESGATYADCMSCNYVEQTLTFVQRALNEE